jgi:hypothetical protein
MIVGRFREGEEEPLVIEREAGSGQPFQSQPQREVIPLEIPVETVGKPNPVNPISPPEDRSRAGGFIDVLKNFNPLGHLRGGEEDEEPMIPSASSAASREGDFRENLSRFIERKIAEGEADLDIALELEPETRLRILRKPWKASGKVLIRPKQRTPYGSMLEEVPEEEEREAEA